MAYGYDKSSHSNSRALWSPVGYAQLFVLLTGNFFILFFIRGIAYHIHWSLPFFFLPSTKGFSVLRQCFLA